MTSQEVVNFLDACIKECEDTWKGHRAIMSECYDRYRHYRDYSKKKGWQHKIVVPTVYPAVKGASGLIRRILMKTDEFFKFVPEKQDNSPQQVDPMTGAPAEDMMDNFARAFTRKVRFHVDECDFIDQFAEGVEASFVMFYGCLKFTPNVCEDTRIVWEANPEKINPATGQAKFEFLREISTRAKLKCEVVNPLMLYFPADRSYIIEESRVQLSDLLLNEANIPYDKKEINRLKKEDYASPGPTTDAEQERFKMLKIFESRNRFRKEVVLHTFWGNLTDDKGNIVVRNGRFVVANKKYVILKPSPSPYWLRNHPYVFITPLKVLFSVIGAGMVDGIRPIINAVDNLVNIAADKAMYTLLPPAEINIGALDDPSQAEGGLVPGKLFKTKGPLGQALHTQNVGDIPQGTFVLADLLRNFVQNYTGWTEFIQGMPTSKGDVTATEVERKTEASSVTFENIAASIEKGGIIEAIELVRDLTIQYFLDPAYNPETLEIFKQEKIDLDLLPEAEKFAFLNKRYPIKVKGLTAFFDDEKKRKDLVELFSLISQVPALAMRLNLEEFLSRILTRYDEPNPEQLILDVVPGVTIDPMTGQPMQAPGMPGTMPGGAPPGGAPGGKPGKQNPADFLRAIAAAGGGQIQ